MKKLLLPIITASVLGLAASAQAAVVAYEGFNYPNGTALPLAGNGTATTATGWSTTSGQDGWRRTDNNNTIFNYTTDTSFSIASPTNYNFPNVGGVARPTAVSAANLTAYRNFATGLSLGSADVQYLSFQFKREPSQWAIFGLRNGTGGNVFSLEARGDNNATRVSSAYGANQFPGFTWNTAADYTIVMRLTTNGSGAGALDMLRYTSSDTIPLTLPGSWTSIYTTSTMTGMTGATATNFTFRLDDSATNLTAIDNIRFGASWDAVAVPEPTTVALLVGGLTALVALRRRRHHS